MNAKQKYTTRNKEYVAAIREKTVCAKCGKKPIEFHRAEHRTNPGRRIAHMISRTYSLAEIKAEIDRCTPLCATCHRYANGIGTRKLTCRDAQVIRVLLGIGLSGAEIAQRYKISNVSISNIRNNKTYTTCEELTYA